MNPVLKYRGGKSREIPRFLQYIPDDFNRYIEPFFGGGAVFFYLEPDSAIINDANTRLMTFYQQLRDDYPTMRVQLDTLQQLYEANQAEFKRLKALTPDERVPNANEDLYYRMRELFNHPDDTYLDGVLYFFINKTAYSGMIRYNNNGEYNVPFGRYPNLNTKLVTQQHSELLQRAELFNLDYNDIFNMAEADDFRIAAGKTRTRETNDASLKKFIATQKSNMRDYADACFRYLRYTGLISISHKSRSISIFEDKIVEVDFILSTVSRDPVYIDDVNSYKAYLFSANTPVLYTDNEANIVDVLMRIGSFTRRELAGKTIEELKDLRDDIVKQHKDAVIHEQVAEIKSYALYSEIIDTFNEIIADEYYDAPLMLEYNTWRAMTMLDGGNIKGNFNFDDAGQPLSTAAGNMPDIECDYDDFALSVEVTLQSGQRQYESEGEPVARHYGQLKKKSGKETYCLFIAPTINAATLAHFYGLNHLSIALYGGKSKIIPLELDQFMRLIENSYNYKTQPEPKDIRRFLDYAIMLCEKATDENNWRSGIQTCVDMWLAS